MSIHSVHATRLWVARLRRLAQPLLLASAYFAMVGCAEAPMERPFPPEHIPPPLGVKAKAEDDRSCIECHADVAAEWAHGAHNTAGETLSPRCAPCHGDGSGQTRVGCRACHPSTPLSTNAEHPALAPETTPCSHCHTAPSAADCASCHLPQIDRARPQPPLPVVSLLPRRDQPLPIPKSGRAHGMVAGEGAVAWPADPSAMHARHDAHRVDLTIAGSINNHQQLLLTAIITNASTVHTVTPQALDASTWVLQTPVATVVLTPTEALPTIAPQGHATLSFAPIAVPEAHDAVVQLVRVDASRSKAPPPPVVGFGPDERTPGPVLLPSDAVVTSAVVFTSAAVFPLQAPDAATEAPRPSAPLAAAQRAFLDHPTDPHAQVALTTALLDEGDLNSAAHVAYAGLTANPWNEALLRLQADIRQRAGLPTTPMEPMPQCVAAAQTATGLPAKSPETR